MDSNRNQEDLDKEIEDLMKVRAANIQLLEDRLKRLNECMVQLHGPEHVAEWNSKIENRTEELTMRYEWLELNLEKMKLDQELEESPQELMDEMKEAFTTILEETDKLENEHKHWEEVEAKYNALGPKFKDLLQQWQELEEKISVKEWALKELEGMQNISGSLDDSIILNDSFHA